MKIVDSTTRGAALLIPLAWILGAGLLLCEPAPAQDNGAAPPEPPSAAEAAETGPASDATPDETTGEETEESADDEQVDDKDNGRKKKGISVLKLLGDGGKLMWPIYLMSMLVVTFGVERLLALRRSKVLPMELINGLGNLAGKKGGLDPRSAYRLCQQFPSSAANVIKAMLLKVGRPHTELEHAVSEANEREAARLYANVRWLSLGAAISPLLGLLGTVGGMIMAFYQTANLPTGANKAEYLAEGIYVALVTTFAGLSVAIPAAVLAHLYEGRIQSLFRELDETLMGMTPQLERFEGRLRVSKEQMDVPVVEAATGTPPVKPAAIPE